MDERAQLGVYLTELHLPAVRCCYVELAEQAAREGLGYECYLRELLGRESEARRPSRVCSAARPVEPASCRSKHR